MMKGYQAPSLTIERIESLDVEDVETLTQPLAAPLRRLSNLHKTQSIEAAAPRL